MNTFAACLLFLSSWMVTAPLEISADRPPLSLELIVPITDPSGEREISMARYPRIHAKLTNESRQPVRVWKDWNTWGYFNLKLFWIADGEQHPIERVSLKHWDGDFPDFWTLPPGESVILEVDLRTAKWTGFPDLYGESIEATLHGTYQNIADPLASEFDVWTGTLHADPIRVVFR
ncbi:hypothetical protein [Pontibacter sp. G13]|uniref:hypothetical protein n=1 Tax=Pontibacter sp. G13 TaxID=3074898 RepID=UPI00288C3B97|nr:hypothetical protein [Pontibacter sp. G13]WNJ17367.1 hypothetical protein RJD25_21160 [Pontibacter sp. G13]